MQHFFDVYELTLTEREPPDHYDRLEIAHAVSARIASELSGVKVATIEKRVPRDGYVIITNASPFPPGGHEEFEVRLSRDDD